MLSLASGEVSCCLENGLIKELLEKLIEDRLLIVKGYVLTSYENV